MTSYRRRSPLWAALTACGLLAAACGSNHVAAPKNSAAPNNSSAGGTPIYIDAVVAKTGPVGPFGSAGLAGMQTAVDMINAGGGVLGRQLVLRSVDDASDASKAVLAAQQLAAETPKSVMMFIGSTTSESSAIIPFVHDELTFSPTTSTSLLDAAKNPDLFGVIYTGSETAVASMKAFSQKHVDKIGIITGTDAGSQAAIPLMVQAMTQAGLQHVDTESVSNTGTDFTVALQKLKSAGATGVYAYFPAPSSFDTVMKGVEQLGWTSASVLGAAGCSDQASLQGVPASVKSQYACVAPAYILSEANPSEAKTSRARDFVQKLPSGLNPQTPPLYASAVFLTAYAIEQTKSTDTATLVNFLNGLENRDVTNELVGTPNPRYSATVHSLANADMTDFWALITLGASGQFQGTVIK